MPRYFEACATSFVWEIPVRGDTGKLYRVSYGSRRHKFGEGRDYACTCPAYQHRRGYCKHIIRNQNKHCSWREELGKPQLAYGTCPQCGAPTRLEVLEDDTADDSGNDADQAGARGIREDDGL